MEEETFQKVMLAAMIIMILIAVTTMQLLMKAQTTITDATKMQCNQVVDMIYEQCGEEEAINLTTLKGRDVMLTYEHGVCIIR